MLFVHIGSLNPQKVAAAKEAFRDITYVDRFDICDAASGVQAQPKSLEDVVSGAMNRARHAIDPMPKDSATHLGVGLESGLVVPYGIPEAGFTVTCCAIARKSAMGSLGYIYGYSSGFTIPPRIMQHVKMGHDLSQATRMAGYTVSEKIGNAEGLIGILSDGRIDRRGQLKEAVRNALFHVHTLL